LEDADMADGAAIYVNKEEGLKRLGTPKFYVKMLNKFLTDTAAENNSCNVNELVDSIQAGDMEKAQVQAHTIKGLTSNLSLTELFHQVQDLEAQIKARDIKPGAPETVKVCFDKTREEIQKVIAQYGA
jgi:HPt (histidine-containing phosphotransfer) domain-containing protein